MPSFYEIPGYVTRFCGKRISFIGSFHRLPGVYALGERGRKRQRGRGTDSDTFLNKRQAKIFQSGTTQVDGNEVQVA